MKYIGVNALDNLTLLLNDTSVKNIFLVCGKGSYKSSGAADKLTLLLKEKNVIVFNDFAVNPEVSDVKRGIKLFREQDIQLTIAVGGGSVIDMAKLVNALAFNNGRPEEYITKHKSLVNYNKPLVAIPTTSGTGSEATHFAVVYIGKVKYSLAESWILPTHVIIDPMLTESLPSYITACTAFDALGQAIESYWSVSSTKESSEYSIEAIQLIMSNIESAVNNPTLENRYSLSKGAYLAGKAINITKTTAPHAFSYHFTSYYDIPHGHAVGLTLGGFLKYNYELTDDNCNDTRGVAFVKNRLVELSSLLNFTNIYDFSDKLYDILDRIGLKVHISDIGMDNNEKIDFLASEIDVERSKNNPRRITKQNVMSIIKEYCKY